MFPTENLAQETRTTQHEAPMVPFLTGLATGIIFAIIVLVLFNTLKRED